MNLESAATNFHDEAMKLADMADAAKRRGDIAGATKLYQQAFELEACAADCFQFIADYEPTRSILYLSAASLAKLAGDLDECRTFAQRGLNGNPPADVAKDLRELL